MSRGKAIAGFLVAAAMVAMPLTAIAAEQTSTLNNGCRITGAGTTYGGSAISGTTPRSNCLTVQVKMWYSPSGYTSKGYTAQPNNVALTVQKQGTRNFSDHNATGDNDPSAWGFRLGS